ncbi:MAG: hypothetical protein H6Q20_1632 [Bacteroidetes bacterium]|nr:hypothetical protein [Bacteroidota bacterium]
MYRDGFRKRIEKRFAEPFAFLQPTYAGAGLLTRDIYSIQLF